MMMIIMGEDALDEDPAAADGDAVGSVAMGSEEGAIVGTVVVSAMGSEEGAIVGTVVAGATVGVPGTGEGTAVRTAVGSLDGAAVGTAVGAAMTTEAEAVSVLVTDVTGDDAPAVAPAVYVSSRFVLNLSESSAAVSVSVTLFLIFVA